MTLVEIVRTKLTTFHDPFGLTRAQHSLKRSPLVQFFKPFGYPPLISRIFP